MCVCVCVYVCVCVCGGGGVWYVCCCAVISAVSSFAVISLRERERVREGEKVSLL